MVVAVLSDDGYNFGVASQDDVVMVTGTSVSDNGGAASPYALWKGPNILPTILTEADGSFSADITQAAAGSCRVSVLLPTGLLVVSDPIVFAG
jgi:hypothetical protein